MPLLSCLNVPSLCHVHELPASLSDYATALRNFNQVSKQFIVSSKTLDRYLRKQEISPKKITLIPNFIPAFTKTDSEITAMRSNIRVKFEIPEKAFVVLSCGSLRPRKAPDRFVETAIALLNKTSASELEVYFYWVGGDALVDYFSAVENMIPEPFKKHIRFLGAQNNPSPFYAGADCLLIASHEEAFGLVMLEAASFSLQCSGSAEFLRKVAGLVSQDNNPQSMAETILLLAQNEQTRLRIDAEAKEILLSQHSPDEHSQGLMQLLLSIC